MDIRNIEKKEVNFTALKIYGVIVSIFILLMFKSQYPSWIGSAVAFSISLILLPLTIKIVEWVRQYSIPDTIVTYSITDIIGKKFFWSYGIFLLAIFFVNLFIYFVVLMYFVEPKVNDEAVIENSNTPSALLDPTKNIITDKTDNSENQNNLVNVTAIGIKHLQTVWTNGGICSANLQLDSFNEAHNIVINVSAIDKNGKEVANQMLSLKSIGESNADRYATLFFEDKALCDDGLTIQVTSAIATFNGKIHDLIKEKLLLVEESKKTEVTINKKVAKPKPVEDPDAQCRNAQGEWICE